MKINLPNVRTHTKEWVAETDKICKDRFDASRPLPFDCDRGQTEDYFSNMLNANVVQEMVLVRRLACHMGQQLSEQATMLFVEDDFEEMWPALSDRDREKHLWAAFKEQEGHSNSADISLLSGPLKLDCPELCWDELVEDKGRGFLGLLMRLIAGNKDDPSTQPPVLEQSRFDEIIGWSDQGGPAQKALLDFRRVLRSHHIVTYITLVLAEYCGTKATYQSLTPEHSKTKETLAAFRPMLEYFMAGDSKETKRWIKEEVAGRKQMKLFCDHCLKVEDKENGKMAACGSCKKIGREVRYCSKACQKTAWKVHKRDCGKKLAVDSVFQDASLVDRCRRVILREDIPPAAPGHHRTAYLLRQISLLNDFPKKDYMMESDGIVAFTLSELPGATVFSIMRNRIMFNADDSALFYVYRVLQTWENMEGNAKRQLVRKQLRKEYGMPFQNVVDALDSGHPPVAPTVSTEELDAMIVFFQKTGRFSEELRNYVPGAKGNKTVTMGLQVGPKKDLMVILKWPADTALPAVTGTPL